MWESFNLFVFVLPCSQQQELEILEDGAEVYKKVGSVLIKQDIVEAASDGWQE